MKIAPSILAADFTRLGAEIKEVEQCGADYIHVDVMDGHFVPNITMGPNVVRAVSRVTSLPLDVHLMIEEADRYLEDFITAGAHIVSVHAEACPHLHRTLTEIKKHGAKAGVVLNPATPLEWVEPVLEEVALVLLMTVNPGFGGQQFISAVVPKITALRQKITERKLQVEIEVDGGIDPETAAICKKAGADVLVAGTAIFAKQDRKRAIEALRRMCKISLEGTQEDF